MVQQREFCYGGWVLVGYITAKWQNRRKTGDLHMAMMNQRQIVALTLMNPMEYSMVVPLEKIL